MKTDARPETEGTAPAFAGYKARIAEVLEKERTRILKDAEREFARIVSEAKQAAQNIVSQAEAKAKQESRDRVKREVERLLAAARDESTRTVDQARQAAAEHTARALAAARHEAETSTRTLLDEARKAAAEASRSAPHLRAAAERNAQEIREMAVLEAGEIIKEAATASRAKGVEEEERLLAEAEDRGRLMIDAAWKKADQTLEMAVRSAGEAMDILARGIEAAGVQSGSSQEQTSPAVAQTAVAPPPTPAPQDREELFQGSIELEVTAQADAAELTQWISMLRKIPGQRVLSNQGSSSGPPYKFLVLNNAPIPLLSMLRAMPLVASASREDKKLLVTLSDRTPPGAPFS